MYEYLMSIVQLYSLSVVGAQTVGDPYRILK